MYDPNTGSLKLIEARKLVLRTTLRPEKEESEDEIEAARQTNVARRQNLGMEFGTKKTKKAISSLTVNAISPAHGAGDGKPKDAATKALLSSIAASSADMPSREALQASVNDAKPRPKANLSATTPKEVYPLDVLIVKEELKHLPVNQWIEAVENKTDIQTRSRFVARRLQPLAREPKSKDPKEPESERLKALRYLQILVDLYAVGKPATGGGRRLPPRELLKAKLGVGDALVSGVVRRFADGG